MSFKDLKKNRTQLFDHIAKKFEESNTNKEYESDDERLWYPAGDKAGNGSAVIRFLPPTENAHNSLPWVKVYQHGFQGPTGSWLVEKCPTSIGKDCPVCEANRELWNSGLESDKKIASVRKRKVQYYSNVYIIKDPGNPENEGKVKIYRYGKKIFDMLNELMHPSFDDVTPVNPFDLWEGANLRLRFKMVDGFRKYDASTFDNVAPLFDDDKKLEEVYNSMYELNEFIEGIKSYDEIKARFDMVVKGTAPSKRKVEVEEEVESVDDTVRNELDNAEELDTPPFDTDDDISSEDFDKFFDDLKD